MINDFTLNEYCRDIAQEICRDASDEDQAMDWATESADGSEYVIYYAKAHDLCRGCNTDAGEDFVAECWADTVMSYDEMACRIAYGEILSRIQCYILRIHQDITEDA